MKKLYLIALLLLLWIPLAGAEESKTLSLQISSLPEAKAGFTQRFIFPFLQGESPLTRDNNIDVAWTGEISPISLNAFVEAVWTPAAFFQFTAGNRIGSGWNIELFDAPVRGIGLNRPGKDGKAVHSGSAFDGIFWKNHSGVTLQADLAAFIPGDWHHVVARTYHEINYKMYSRAGSDESWYYENDDGENVNGLNYYGLFFAGYQMPIFLDTVGLLAEMDLYLYDTDGRGRWGDDLPRWTFSGLFHANITKQLGAALLVQFRTFRNYLEEDWKDLHYRNRRLDTSNPLGLEFYRAALVMTYTL